MTIFVCEIEVTLLLSFAGSHIFISFNMTVQPQFPLNMTVALRSSQPHFPETLSHDAKKI
jgi:hypothetical protein